MLLHLKSLFQYVHLNRASRRSHYFPKIRWLSWARAVDICWEVFLIKLWLLLFSICFRINDTTFWSWRSWAHWSFFWFWFIKFCFSINIGVGKNCKLANIVIFLANVCGYCFWWWVEIHMSIFFSAWGYFLISWSNLIWNWWWSNLFSGINYSLRACLPASYWRQEMKWSRS